MALQVNHICDGPKRGRDPTQTLRIRRSFWATTRLRIRMARQKLQSAIVNHDVLGLSESSYPPDIRVAIAAHQIEQALAELRGPWPQPYIERAWAHGLAIAHREGYARQVVDTTDLTILAQEAQHELIGIVGAITQGVNRTAIAAERRRKGTHSAWRMISKKFDAIAEPRFKAFVNVSVIKAHNWAKLEAYREAGVNRVGIVPETQKHRPHIRDADGDGEDELVGILTAGDDKVCQRCEDYADDEPYEIDEIELPLHPNCRCAVYPYFDKRFAGDAWSEEAREASAEARKGSGEKPDAPKKPHEIRNEVRAFAKKSRELIKSVAHEASDKLKSPEVQKELFASSVVFCLYHLAGVDMSPDVEEAVRDQVRNFAVNANVSIGMARSMYKEAATRLLGGNKQPASKPTKDADKEENAPNEEGQEEEQQQEPSEVQEVVQRLLDIVNKDEGWE